MTERELMEKVSPGFVRWLMRYAPGYELLEDADWVGFMLIEVNGVPVFDLLNHMAFRLLLHRAVDNWNISPENRVYLIENGTRYAGVYTPDGEEPYAKYLCCDYAPDTLTNKECVLLHCLMDVYSEVCAIAPVGEPV